MIGNIESVRKEFARALEQATTREQLEQVRIKYLARNGLVAELFEHMKSLPADQKPQAGKLLNSLKVEVQQAFEEKRNLMEGEGAKNDTLDRTMPGRPRPLGSKHPITQTIDEIRQIFRSMGFSSAYGPEIETDHYNFEALNFPPDHPARDMQDTFFLSPSKSVLLRTHTSPVQIRTMEGQRPPVREIMPGRVYRNEAVSARSLVSFHQVEGLYVDTGVTFSDLKGTLVAFARQFYGKDVRYKFRPTFFPFTEPSADMYISCFLCKGKGCRMCKQNGWLEILGSGMVHPHLFRNVGYDPEKYSGFAFGMGIERIASLRYGVDDIRMFYENDVRFLNQF
ncbi:MAG: phenylalanine--tRNA ligase subunit alpha [Ignavibacteriales bacterium]|nr:phenylalanine--tRNA ligase subunit alpha [Ignavibacteriales bacterium]